MIRLSNYNSFEQDIISFISRTMRI